VITSSRVHDMNAAYVYVLSQNALSRGPKVGCLFTRTTRPTVGPRNAITTPKLKVGFLVNVALKFN